MYIFILLSFENSVILYKEFFSRIWCVIVPTTQLGCNLNALIGLHNFIYLTMKSKNLEILSRSYDKTIVWVLVQTKNKKYIYK